jgi:hypothetical protein
MADATAVSALVVTSGIFSTPELFDETGLGVAPVNSCDTTSADDCFAFAPVLGMNAAATTGVFPDVTAGVPATEIGPLFAEVEAIAGAKDFNRQAARVGASS